MKPTLEQLNELSDYELNCAAAEKLGLPLLERYGKSVFANIDTRKCAPDQKGAIDYCNNSHDYMKLAIEHGISIWLDNDGEVSCSYNGDINGQVSLYLPKAQTGRAVVIAFLLMGDE